MKYILFLILSLSTFANNIKTKNIYHIHQAIGYMEEFSSGRCPNGLERSKVHMASIKKPNKLLESVIKDVKLTLKKESFINKSIIEGLRFQIQEVIDKTIKDHPESWHQEFRACL